MNLLKTCREPTADEFTLLTPCCWILGLGLLVGCGDEAPGPPDSSTGGQFGAGGRMGSGASSNSGGGHSDSGGNGGGSGAGTSDTCDPNGSPDFSITAMLSPEIETVGIVQWTLPGQSIVSAEIRFGLDPCNLRMSAPVDLQEALSGAPHRTLLVGMKPNETYSYRIRATVAGTVVESALRTLETGFLPNGLPPISVQDTDPSALWGGFTIYCTGVGSGTGMNAGGGWALIFDQDADYVWAYDLSGTDVSECSRARLSLDGKHLWLGNFSNVSPTGALMRVSMDGLVADPPISLPGRHHDFALLPNGNIVYHEQENGGGYGPDGNGSPFSSSEMADVIYEYDLETSQKLLIYDQNADFSAAIEDADGAHTNHIEYVPHLSAISFSLRHSSTLGLISYPDGQLLGIFSGISDQFGMEWDYQHGHEFVPPNRLLVFNNGNGTSSPVLEFEYDLQTKTSTLLSSYTSGYGTISFGDVQRLPNGNTFITYSNAGVIQEIDASQNVLRQMEMESFAYPQHLKSLYGPPPPFDQQ